MNPFTEPILEYGPGCETVPGRVVSLVPSLTESLFDLGLGRRLVGVTDYCVHPAGETSRLPHVGGTKNPDLEAILALKPDLVLTNWEENTESSVDALAQAGISVWVTHPRSIQDTLDMLWALAGRFEDQTAALRLKSLAVSLDWAEAAAQSHPLAATFCPIWYEPGNGGPEWWMTFNRQTYCHDVVRACGGQNIFAERQRRYPLAADLGQAQAEPAGRRDTRYPRLTLDEIREAQPEVILLPDEPFAFEQAHRQDLLERLADTPAARGRRIYLVEGSLITWAGTRCGRALQELPVYFEGKDLP
jgi:iron complex transport system substrate-binding protein